LTSQPLVLKQANQADLTISGSVNVMSPSKRREHDVRSEAVN
jgi:hypothetical protein